MRPDSVALVLLSAVLHATWNFLLKRAGGSQVVVAMSKLAEVICFAPVFALWSAPTLSDAPTVALYTGVAAVGVLANYVAIAAAYRHGDLSFVYPISRGAALGMLPVLGFVFLDERIGTVDVVALIAIGTGILAIQLRDLGRDSLRQLRVSLASRATRFALLAAATTAVYTIWDKRAVSAMQPFAYMYLYTLIVAAAYGWWLMARVPADERRAEWRQHAPAVVAIGVLNVGSYLLILHALRTETSSLVIGTRQLSIVFGVVLGWIVLREGMTRPRALGVGLIVLGCLALSQ